MVAYLEMKFEAVTITWSMKMMMKIPSIQVVLNFQLLNLQALQIQLNLPSNSMMYWKFLQHPQRENISVEPFVDYSQSQVFTLDLHVEALESIAKKKHEIIQEKTRKKTKRACETNQS